MSWLVGVAAGWNGQGAPGPGMDSWGEGRWQCICVAHRVQVGPTWARRYMGLTWCPFSWVASKIIYCYRSDGGVCRAAWQEWVTPPPLRRLTHRPSEPGLASWPRGGPRGRGANGPDLDGRADFRGVTWRARDRHVCVAIRGGATWGRSPTVHLRGSSGPRGPHGPCGIFMDSNLESFLVGGGQDHLFYRSDGRVCRATWPRGGPRGRGASGFDARCR